MYGIAAYSARMFATTRGQSLADRELVRSGMIRAGVLAYERARRKDNTKRIGQLLTMELRYRNVRSVGVAA